jgi:hypothetical protein
MPHPTAPPHSWPSFSLSVFQSEEEEEKKGKKEIFFAIFARSLAVVEPPIAIDRAGSNLHEAAINDIFLVTLCVCVCVCVGGSKWLSSTRFVRSDETRARKYRPRQCETDSSSGFRPHKFKSPIRWGHAFKRGGPGGGSDVVVVDDDNDERRTTTTNDE